jgi:hypothetical protein
VFLRVIRVAAIFFKIAVKLPNISFDIFKELILMVIKCDDFLDGTLSMDPA